MRFPLLALCLLLAGCAANVQRVMVNDVRAPIPIGSVGFRPEVDTNFFSQYVCNLYARVPLVGNAAETAERKMKKSAAEVGANVLIIMHWHETNLHFFLEAQAYYVDPTKPIHHTHLFNF
jgi:hypothetical protein